MGGGVSRRKEADVDVESAHLSRSATTRNRADDSRSRESGKKKDPIPHDDQDEDEDNNDDVDDEVEVVSKRGQQPKPEIRTRNPTFRVFEDKYETLEEVQDALRRAGLESSNLIIGIDFTKSNTWTGKNTFGGQCLHSISGNRLNPYQSVVSILGRTLEAFDDDNLIPAFGFGDIETGDHGAFPFFPDRRPCVGFQEVLARYEAITPGICLSGPTNFAPVIREALKIVQETRKYHILVLVADGQVTKRADTEAAIVEAANFPLSIITVGVGDGPWDTMTDFDDGLPSRRFDNFQFVEFHKAITESPQFPEAAFALAALMEIPEQFQALQELNLI